MIGAIMFLLSVASGCLFIGFAMLGVISVAYFLDVPEQRTSAAVLIIMSFLCAWAMYALYRYSMRRRNLQKDPYRIRWVPLLFSVLLLLVYFFMLREGTKDMPLGGACLLVAFYGVTGMVSLWYGLGKPEKYSKAHNAVSSLSTIAQPQSDSIAEVFDPRNLAPDEYELYVARHLISHGYERAEVTKASGDYGVDVIAVNSDGWRIAIQCKRYRGSVGVAAVQEVIAGKEYYGCDLAAVYTTGSYTQQAISIARKTHVKLYILDQEGLRMIG